MHVFCGRMEVIILTRDAGMHAFTVQRDSNGVHPCTLKVPLAALKKTFLSLFKRCPKVARTNHITLSLNHILKRRSRGAGGRHFLMRRASKAVIISLIKDLPMGQYDETSFINRSLCSVHS